jgi:hypothetical protein
MLMMRRLLQVWTVGAMVLAGSLLAGVASAQNVTVTAANPPSGAQDTVSLVVKITGKNFAPGARSDFFKSGTTDPGGVTVRSTQFVSSTEVDATVDIAATAAIASFDIRVSNTNGRSGKGGDLFNVVQRANGPASACTVVPLDTAHFQLVRTLNQAINGHPQYRSALGVGLAARRTTLTYSGLPRDVIVLAAGTNANTPGKIEIFFVDPATGALLDNVALVSGGPVQPHISVNVAEMSSSFGPQQVAIGDVNNDGIPDIVASQWNGGGGNGNVALAVGHAAPSGVLSYSLVAIPPPAPGSFGLSVALGDLDADGFDEIAVSSPFGGNGKKMQFPKVFIYSATGGVPSLVQTVAPASTQISTNLGYGSHVRIGDVNGDGRGDLVVGVPKWVEGGVTEAGAVFVHLSTGSRPTMVQVAPIVLTSSTPQLDDDFGSHVAIGELTGDPAGQNDLLALDYLSSPQRTADVFDGPIVATGQSTIPSLRLAPQAGMSRGWATTGAAIADLTGDGLGDVVVGAPNAPDSGSCGSVGAVHVFVAQGTTGTGATGWTRYLLQPPTVGPGQFGWSTVTVPGTSLIFIGENGRDVGSVTQAGQVYIYKVLAP